MNGVMYYFMTLSRNKKDKCMISQERCVCDPGKTEHCRRAEHPFKQTYQHIFHSRNAFVAGEIQ
jgi:hypothetical protein